jgi:hypothetical protein
MSKKKVVKQVLKKFRVDVSRIGYGNCDIEVQARNPKEAMEAAEEVAGNYSFSEHTSQYEAQGATEIK